MSTLIGVVGGVHVSVFASPEGPRVQIYVMGEVGIAQLTHDDLTELEGLVRSAKNHLANRQRERDSKR